MSRHLADYWEAKAGDPREYCYDDRDDAPEPENTERFL